MSIRCGVWGRRRSSLLVALGSVCLLAVPCQGANWHFDVSPSVACEPAEDAAFRAQVPGEKLIRARCQVSVLRVGREGEAPSECLFHFFSPETNTRVHDFSPKTQLGTDVVGTIQITREGESNQGLKVGAGADAPHVGSAEVSANHANRQALSRSYAQLPPQELLAAAGTLGRGTGVYFKLRQTSQQSLEGTHDLTLVLRVPIAWRAGYLRLHCQTLGMDSGTGAQRSGGHDQAAFLIPLYQLGDAEAMRTAVGLMTAEQELIAIAEQRRDALRRASKPSLWHEIAIKSPRLPDQWLASILRQSSEEPAFSFERELPAEVAAAVQRVRARKRELRIWSDRPAELTGAIEPVFAAGG